MKKGFTGLINILIISVILFIVVLSISGSFTKLFLGQFSKVEKCRLSIIAAAEFAKKAGGSIIDIDCPRQYEEIGSEVILKQKNDYDYTLIYQKLAEELKTCWYKMGEGKISGFDREDLSQSNACVVCSKISFSNELKEFSKTISNSEIIKASFDDYLANAKIKSGQTYTDYFSIFRRERIVPFFFREIEGTTLSTHSSTINLEKDYFIVFAMVSPSLAVEYLKLIPGIKATVGETPIPSLILTESTNFKYTNCGYLYN